VRSASSVVKPQPQDEAEPGCGLDLHFIES